jgi:hypothetical protein
MCFEYDEYVQFGGTRRVRKTRKRHRCNGCLKGIPTGSTCTNNTGLFDGHWFSEYVCDDCQRLLLSIVAEELREGCPWHTAWCATEEMQEYSRDRHEPVPLLQGTLEECREEVNRIHAEQMAEWHRKRLENGLYSEVDWARNR